MAVRVGFFVDSNLLVLLIVGNVGREFIAKHRRLRGYSAADYDILLDLLAPFDHVYVTPNTLTEASNLLAQHGEPERSRFMEMLRTVIHESQEVVVASAAASVDNKFLRLGLTDAALLSAISSDTPLITTDQQLYLAALAKGADLAENFSHYRL